MRDVIIANRITEKRYWLVDTKLSYYPLVNHLIPLLILLYLAYYGITLSSVSGIYAPSSL